MIIGASVVFLFSGLAISAVGRAAGRVVYEVRAQFRDHPGIMDFTEKPDYARVVDICTKDSLRELATPGLLAIFAPVSIGFLLGVGPLAGYLAGAIGAGVLMAIFLANSGGAWDNAKKMVEDGVHGGKGTDAHAATVIGDTVGDPFKDTAGPSINPLIKVMNLVAVLVAPAVVKLTVGEDSSIALRILLGVVAFAIIAAAVIVSKRRRVSMGDAPAASKAPAQGLSTHEPRRGGRPHPGTAAALVPPSCPRTARAQPAYVAARTTRQGREDGAAMTQFSLFGAAAADPVPRRPRRGAARRRALGAPGRRRPAVRRRRRPLARRRPGRRVRAARSRRRRRRRPGRGRASACAPRSVPSSPRTPRAGAAAPTRARPPASS